MNKIKPIILFLLLIVIVILVVVVGINKKTYTITVIIQNEDDVVYNEEIKTKKTTLIDVLKELNVDLKTDKSDYGEYIVSLKGIEEELGDDGSFYWDYYVNGVYGEESISICGISDQSTYMLVYEYHENQ